MKRSVGFRARAGTTKRLSRPLISIPMDFRHKQHISLEDTGVGATEHSSGTVISPSIQAGLNQTSGDSHSLTKVSSEQLLLRDYRYQFINLSYKFVVYQITIAIFAHIPLK